MSEQKTITFDHFKAWLEGIEELQDEEWTPNASQWRKIREKISSIQIPSIVTYSPNTNVQYSPTPQNFPEVPSRIPAAFSSLESGTVKGKDGIVDLKVGGSGGYETPLA